MAQKQGEQQRRRAGGARVDFSLTEKAVRDGCPVVRFKAEEWRRLAERDQDLTLVGVFEKSRPSIDEVRRDFQRLLPVKGAAHIGVVDGRTILLRFNLVEVCLCVLERRQVLVARSCVRFEKWVPDWRRRRSAVVPVWI